jgi:hypothetical protein
VGSAAGINSGLVAFDGKARNEAKKGDKKPDAKSRFMKAGSRFKPKGR